MGFSLYFLPFFTLLNEEKGLKMDELRRAKALAFTFFNFFNK